MLADVRVIPRREYAFITHHECQDQIQVIAFTEIIEIDSQAIRITLYLR